MSARTKAYLTLLFVTAIWGIAGPVIKFTVGQIPPFIFLFYRFVISGFVSLILLKLIKRPGYPKSVNHWVTIIVYAVLSTTVSLGLLFLGYEKTSAISASIIDGIYPLMVGFVGVLFLHEHITHREKIGMSIAFVGMALVVVEPIVGGQLANNGTFEGNLYILASLLVGVMLAVMAKLILRTKITPAALTHLSFIIGLLTLTPVILFIYPVTEIVSIIRSLSLSAHLGVWYMALISGTLAYTLWHAAQKTIEIGETSLFTYMYPLFTLPLSIFWLHEKTSPLFLAGVLISAVGVVLAEMKARR